jgi:hypothetical protein
MSSDIIPDPDRHSSFEDEEDEEDKEFNNVDDANIGVVVKVHISIDILLLLFEDPEVI